MIQQTARHDQDQTQLELFESRLPRRPYCTDNLSHGLMIRDKARASRRRYIQVNPPWLRSFVVMDVDRNGAALAWEDAHLPMPMWSSMNPANGHAHLSWAIEAPVLLGQHDRQEPMRYLAVVESAIRAKLDADPGYSGLITKNPTHRHWRNLWAPGGLGVYSLGDLSEWVDLPKHAPRRKPEAVGLGRNCSTFDYLRFYAYREIRLWRDSDVPPPGHADRRGIYTHWLAHLYARAMDYTHNEHPVPLDHQEVHWIAKSVAHWVWTRFDAEASDARFSRRQAARGVRSGEARRAASQDKQVQARLMRAGGMSIRQIAADLGVGKSTVARWVSHEP